MSLDISLMEEVHSQNITHNLNKMAYEAGIYQALWHPKDCGIWNARELAIKLKPAICDMKDRPEHYKRFDSANGWGTYENFIPWLDRLYIACLENPNARIESDI